jgi:hypothetical protein
LLVESNTKVRTKSQRGFRDRHMRAQGKDWRGDLIPVIVAAIIAVAGQTVVLFSDFGTGNDSQARGNAGMITAAVVSRAGAIEIPSEPADGRPVAWGGRRRMDRASPSLPLGDAK